MQSDVLHHYSELYSEQNRLFRGEAPRLEFARSQELITRHLPEPPQVVLDVGGGPGVYSCWLARNGYETHLIDLVPRHVEQALGASSHQPEYPIASATEGDARSLEWADESYDAVLLMGPLYHLIDRDDRLTALREAYRVVRDGGVIFISAVNRFVSLLDGIMEGHLDDPEFMKIVLRDLKDGTHINHLDNPDYFTTAFFHLPEELEAEVAEAGLSIIETVALQGPGWLASDFDERWADPVRRERLMDLLRVVEHETAMMGVSHHFMTIARK